MLTQMTGLENLLVWCLFVGGGLFIVRVLFQALGPEDDAEEGAAARHAAATNGEARRGFQARSIEGVAGFLVVFGLVGFGLVQKAKLPGAVAVAVGAAAALVCVWGASRICGRAGER